MTHTTRESAMKGLDVFIGEWRLGLGRDNTVWLAGARSDFEWILDGQFLVQRTEIPDPNAPNNLNIVAYDRKTGGYTQHYFDSRGVVRLYAMTFEDGIWRLQRETADFSALGFSQRFEGTFSADRNTISATWEINEGAGWKKDFDLTYARVVR